MATRTASRVDSLSRQWPTLSFRSFGVEGVTRFLSELLFQVLGRSLLSQGVFAVVTAHYWFPLTAIGMLTIFATGV